MENQELDKANEILKGIYIKQAIPQGFEFNPAYTEDNRDLLIKLSIDKKLEAMGAQLLIQNGEAKIVRKASPELEYFDEKQTRVTLNSLVPQAIASLGAGSAQAVDSSETPFLQWISDEEYIKDGIRYTKEGMNWVADSTEIRRRQLSQQRPTTFQEQIAQIDRELGIKP